jgi:hypothetical protein
MSSPHDENEYWARVLPSQSEADELRAALAAACQRANLRLLDLEQLRHAAAAVCMAFGQADERAKIIAIERLSREVYPRDHSRESVGTSPQSVSGAAGCACQHDNSLVCGARGCTRCSASNWEE